jgi:hypothetical protein
MMWDDVERRRPLARASQAEAWRRDSLDDRQLSRLTSALVEEATQAGGALRVTVTKQTGTVEVRISGKNARRRFMFQGPEVHPTHIRQAVSKALEGYAASLADEIEHDPPPRSHGAFGDWSPATSVVTGGTSA